MKKFLPLFLLLFSLALSQNAEDFNITVETNVTTEIEKNENADLKPYYFIGEAISMNSAIINIMNESYDYIVSNITENFTVNLTPGYYYLEVFLPDGNKITHPFTVIQPEIDVAPRILFVNETLKIFVRDYVGKNFHIQLAENVYDFVNLNETSTFSLIIENSGNYTLYVNNESFEIQVLPRLPEKKSVKLNLSLNNYAYKNQKIDFNISGDPNTTFNLSIILNDNMVMQLMDKTSEEGLYFGNLYFEEEGSYTVIFSYESEIEVYNLTVLKYPQNFTILNLYDFYEKNVTFTLKGPPLTQFYLYFTSKNFTKVYFLQTSEEGSYEFEDEFEKGEYELSLIVEDETVLSKTIYVNTTREVAAEDFLNDTILHLNEDVLSNETAFILKGRNITFDCNGHKIEANISIEVNDAEDVEIKSCIIENSYIAIFIENSKNVKVRNIKTINNLNGVIVKNSENVTISDSDLSDNEFYGLLFFNVKNPNVENTNVTTKTNVEMIVRLKD
ncbi:MAG: NosD domain-containing protein [Candidatus Aenigmatarchaeota archaeon]